MTRRPCLVCGTPSAGSYCPAHARNRNLARDLLELVANRDGWICQLCGEPVSRIRDRSPLSPSLDHVKPLAQGGTDAPSNLRLAHNGCNARQEMTGGRGGDAMLDRNPEDGQLKCIRCQK